MGTNQGCPPPCSMPPAPDGALHAGPWDAVFPQTNPSCHLHPLFFSLSHLAPSSCSLLGMSLHLYSHQPLKLRASLSYLAISVHLHFLWVLVWPAVSLLDAERCNNVPMHLSPILGTKDLLSPCRQEAIPFSVNSSWPWVCVSPELAPNEHSRGCEVKYLLCVILAYVLKVHIY